MANKTGTQHPNKTKYKLKPMYVTREMLEELRDLKENWEFIKEYPNFVRFRNKKHGFDKCINITHYRHLLQITDSMIQNNRFVTLDENGISYDKINRTW